MTAVAGFWCLDGRFDPSAECSAMVAAQAAYGLAESSGRLDRIAFGIRLHPHFIDADERQPLIGGEGRFALAADVRLDNRPELAEALGCADSPFIADSALLLGALERWGEGALPRLLGDFAFAFYDRSERRLLLARDPLGQRPLFWHRGAGFVAFASMPSGLHALGMVDERPDEETLLDYLASLPRSGPASFYDGIERVEPGHSVTLTPTETKRTRYWHPQRGELRLKRFDDYVDAYRSQLDSAVSRRLRGAGELVAAHLSGGWDSSAVAATGARLLAPFGGRVIGFTHVPRAADAAPGNRFPDEGALAGATAALHPNIRHVTLRSSNRSPVEELDRYAALFGRPVFNLCNHVWLSEIRDAARDAGARVLLTGEIGNWTISAAPNTLLADYLRQARWLAWSREAWAMTRSGRARLRGVAASSFAPWMPDALWERLGRLSSSPSEAASDVIHPRLREGVAARRRQADDRRGGYFERAAGALAQMDFGEHRKGILGGWGIDKRDPTADVRLIEFCLSLPLEMLMSNGVRRPLARAALADRVAPEVLDEPRKGYQSADWHVGLTNDRTNVARLVGKIATDATASRLIDVDRLRALLADWPEGGWNEPRTVAAYRNGLLKALTAGHFILAARRGRPRDQPVPASNDSIAQPADSGTTNLDPRQEGGRYALFGLIVRSELLLPLPPTGDPGSAEADVEVRFGPVDAPMDAPIGYSAVAGATLLNVKDVGHFLIRGGREVVIAPAPAASDRNLRLFLLGSAFGALLHQRGLLPLHANAIDLGGRAVAFCGHSGAGKSTMAAWFHDRGHVVLADDVCVIGFEEGQRALVYPGIPRLRLWREALEASGREAGEYDRSFDAVDKFDVPTHMEMLEPLPLAAVYLLSRADEDARIDRLTGVEAVDALVGNTYRGGYLRTIRRTGPHLAACVALARTVPIFKAHRLWGFDQFDEEARRLLAHAEAQPAPG